MTRSNPIAELLPLKPAVFEIMLTLVGGEEHGLAILEEVDERTGSAVRLLPGTLYRILHRLVENGLIEEIDGLAELGDPDGRRRYYKLTSAGREVVAAEARRLDATVAAARSKRLLDSPIVKEGRRC